MAAIPPAHQQWVGERDQGLREIRSRLDDDIATMSRVVSNVSADYVQSYHIDKIQTGWAAIKARLLSMVEALPD